MKNIDNLVEKLYLTNHIIDKHFDILVVADINDKISYLKYCKYKLLDMEANFQLYFIVLNKNKKLSSIVSVAQIINTGFGVYIAETFLIKNKFMYLQKSRISDNLHKLHEQSQSNKVSNYFKINNYGYIEIMHE